MKLTMLTALMFIFIPIAFNAEIAEAYRRLEEFGYIK